MASDNETGPTLAARLWAGGGWWWGWGGGELGVLWMLADRDRLEEGALILLVCVSGGCTHVCRRV